MDGSSIRITSGSDISARPKASICCSPPDSSPAAPVAALVQDREELIDLRHHLRVVGLRGGVTADPQILLDGQWEEDLAPPLGHQGQAVFDDHVRELAQDLFAVDGDRSLGVAEESGDRAQAGRLAGALAPSTRVIRPAVADIETPPCTAWTGP